MTEYILPVSKRIGMFVLEYAPDHLSSNVNTLRSYHKALTLYLVFLGTVKKVTKKKLSYKHFERSVIEEWMEWLADERGNSPQTVNSRLAAVRAFLDYLSSKEPTLSYLHEDAMRIKRRKVPKRKVKGLSKPAVKALLSAPDTRTRAGKRDVCLMTVLYTTAIRIDECLSLKIKDLKLDDPHPSLTVLGKGAKNRTIPLPKAAVSHLEKFISLFHGEKPDGESYLFYSRNKGLDGKLSQTAVSKALKKHAKTAHEVCDDVLLDLHAHQFRHARATHWLDEGFNIANISRLLGHEDIKTTMIYLDISLAQITEAMAKLESEEDKNMIPKWKDAKGDLVSFCGLN